MAHTPITIIESFAWRKQSTSPRRLRLMRVDLPYVTMPRPGGPVLFDIVDPSLASLRGSAYHRCQTGAEAVTPRRFLVINPGDLQIFCWILGLFSPAMGKY